tara:strand:- start:9991 stop:10674 length:684 start_codon:yes stop_codon:yes gene_type:complete
MKWKIGLIAAAGVLLAVPLAVPGCGDKRDANGDGIVTRDEAADSYADDLATLRGIADGYKSTADELADEVEALRAELAEISEDDPTSAVVVGKIDELLEAKSSADEIVDGATAAIERIQSRIDAIPPEGVAADVDAVVIAELVATLGGLLPPPWGVILGGSATGIGLLWRKVAQLTRQRDGAIGTVEHIKRSSPEVAEFMDKNAAVIRGIQGGETVARQIDKARGKT